LTAAPSRVICGAPACPVICTRGRALGAIWANGCKESPRRSGGCLLSMFFFCQRRGTHPPALANSRRPVFPHGSVKVRYFYGAT
jgi:hypothetical protein